MSRIIKFRAWNIQQGKFIDIASLSFHKYEGVCVSVLGSDPHQYPSTFPSDENVIMQFTGSKDKHGNDIYEDDLMKHPEFSSAVKVNWHDDGCWAMSSWDFRRTDPSLGEVIGNAHQNPELL